MTIEEADEILKETAESVRGAIDYQHGLIADARESIDLLERAWKSWNVEALESLGILTRRQAERVAEALETA